MIFRVIPETAIHAERIEPIQQDVRPSHYATAEGRIWEPWTGPASISVRLLEERRLRMADDQQCIWIYGIQVHALRFGGTVRWDCVHGWTD